MMPGMADTIRGRSLPLFTPLNVAFFVSFAIAMASTSLPIVRNAAGIALLLLWFDCYGYARRLANHPRRSLFVSLGVIAWVAVLAVVLFRLNYAS